MALILFPPLPLKAPVHRQQKQTHERKALLNAPISTTAKLQNFEREVKHRDRTEHNLNVRSPPTPKQN